MARQPRRPDASGSADAHTQPGSLLRRLHEDPFDAVGRIAGEIGPRRVTSLAEAQAAAYLDGRLRRAGMRVVADAFRTTAGPGLEGVLLALLALAGVILYYWLPLPSLCLAIWNLIIASVALSRPDLPLLARRRSSQNVIATRAITGAPAWRVVLLAPLDSPLAAGWVARFIHTGTRPLLGRVVACAALVLLALLALGGPLEVQRIWWYAQALPTAYLLAMAALDLWSLRAPATPGAINHAGALATLLASAGELTSLASTELWAVGLGATNTGAGVADLLRRYPFDRERTLFVGLEAIGAGALSYVTREGLLPQYLADPLLLQLAANADAADPLIDAEPRAYRQEPTIAGGLLRTGRRAVTIMGLDANGRAPYRGAAADTVDAASPQIVERAVRLVVGLVRQIDATSTELRVES